MSGSQSDIVDGDAPPPPTSLRKQVGTVAAASTVALLVGQLLSIGQTIALARLLTPTDVGIFAAGGILTSFVTNVVEGGLRASLIHREDRLEDASETVFRATLLTGAVMTVLALAASPLIGLIFDSRTTGVVAASMAGSILLFSLSNVPEALLQRGFSVRRRLIVGPAVALTFATTSITLAVLGLGVWSLVLGSYASTSVYILLLWWLCDWRPGRGTADRAMYSELFRYGSPLAAAAFLDQTVQGIQSIVTGRLLGVQSLGLFRYGDRLAGLPVNAIVDIGANALFPAYARISKEADRFRRVYVRALGLAVMGSAAVAGLLIATGTPLVVVVLGEQWRGTGDVLVALAAVSVGTALSTSAEAIKATGRTALLNYVTGIDVVLGIGLVVLLTPFLGLFGTGLAISITSLVSGATLALMVRSLLGVRWRELGRAVVPYVLAAAVPTVAVRLLESLVLMSDDRTLVTGLLLLVVDGLVFVAVYLVALRVFVPDSWRLLGTLVAGQGSLRERISRVSEF